MTLNPPRGTDVDTNALVATLRELADSIEAAETTVTAVHDAGDFDAADAAKARLELEYISENGDLYRPVEFEVPGHE